MKKLLLTVILCLISSGSWAQCNGVFGANTYCGNGTGTAAPPTAQTTNIIDVLNTGAKCDGVTDDTAAFQTAITQAQLTGRALRFSGTCKISSSLSITNAIDFGGYSAASSSLSATTSAFNAININARSPVSLHDFNISGQNGSEAIDVTNTGSENANSRFDNLDITSWATGIHFVRASGWVVSRTRIESVPSGGTGIIIENQNVGDSGDNILYGNNIQCSTNGSAVLWKSSGGLYMAANKILGTNCAANMIFTLCAGCSTADILITGNSMEAQPTSAGIIFTRATSQGALYGITFTGNEIIGGTNVVSVPTDANGAWLHQLTITGNALTSNSTSAIGIVAIDSATQVAIAYNSMTGQTSLSRPVIIGTGVTYGVVGPNTCSLPNGGVQCGTSITSGASISTFAPF